MDTLIVKGLGRADGEYDFDLIELANIGSSASLTTREQHKVKVDSGVLPADLVAAVRGLDAAVMVSLASIVLARAGKTVNDERLWDARFVYAFGETPDLDAESTAVAFVLADREAQEDDAEDPQESENQRSPNGGGSSGPMSEIPGSDPSATGLRVLPKSATSAPETLAS